MQQVPVPVSRTRLGHSALVALLLTIGLAVFAAYAGPYGRPDVGARATPGKTGVGGARAVPVMPTMPMPPATPTAGAARPTAAPLPKLARFGPSAPGGRVLVRAEAYAFVNLDAGALEPIRGAGWPSQVVRTRTGQACVCVRLSSDAQGATARVNVSSIGPGLPRTPISVGSYRGLADPALSRDNQDPAVLVTASTAPDGRTIYVGTAVRGREVWERSVAVVDLEGGRVAQRRVIDHVPLTRRVEDPAAPSPVSAGEAPTMALVGPPDVRFSPDGGHAMLFAWQETYAGPARQHWLATLEGGLLGDLRPFQDRAEWLASDSCADEGFASATTYYALCATWTPSPTISWLKLGGPEREISLDHVGSGNSLMVDGVLDAARGKYYVWSPDTLGVARVDLLDGRLEQRVKLTPPATGAVDEGALTGLARALSAWVAPVAVGKTFLQPALALSPDGSRLYAIGVNGPQNRISYSSGLWAIDTAALTEIGRWQPTADFASLAVTSDGRFVLASGMARVDAEGNENDWPASLTAYDALTGDVRLIAGDLGSGWIYFPRELNR